MARNVHLVGSVALDTPEEVFATAGRLLGERLKRVPDGEPGGRRAWIAWQAPLLRNTPGLAPIDGERGGASTLVRLADGLSPDQLHFGELGYYREARASYFDFQEAKRRGELHPGIRFQVSLPTPLAVIGRFCVPEDIQKILPAYERAMVREIERLSVVIPHQDLAIQWDVCIEMVQWDGRWAPAPAFPGMEQVFRTEFARLSAAVPDGVELGFHLCYGDLDARHFIEPQDATKMVELANLLLESAGRSVQWLHMPVPIDRDDDAFFAPMANLRVPSGTELYLGLGHVQDGVEGAKRRIAVAEKYAPAFGVSSECGISRGRDADTAVKFMQVFAGAAEA